MAVSTQAAARWPVLLIEHGQTRFDRQGRVHGLLDPPLSAKGREQAARLGLKLAGMAQPPTRLHSSDRRRAQETARLAGTIAGIPVTVTPALRPLDVGIWSGGDEHGVARRLEPYFDNPRRRIPGGDRVAEWRARHVEYVRALAARARQTRERPALVTHSNVIGSLAAPHDGHGGRAALAHPPRAGEVRRVHIPISVTQERNSHALDV